MTQPLDRSATALPVTLDGRGSRTPTRSLMRIDPRGSGFAALLSVGAILLAFLIGVLLGPERHDEGFAPALALAGLLVVTRYVALRMELGAWVIPLDAAACLAAVLLTSAPHSEFHFVVVAGVWWAGRLPARRGAAIFALAFLAPYLVLVVPGAYLRGSLAEAGEDFLTVALLAVLVDWFMTLDRRVMRLSAALDLAGSLGESPIEVRRRLALAAGESPLPIDTLVVAGQLGLTADQAELLGYLLLGFGNAQIAEAIGRSDATVRYRLTALYRALGVRGRRAAIERARSLGLDSLSDVRG